MRCIFQLYIIKALVGLHFGFRVDGNKRDRGVATGGISVYRLYPPKSVYLTNFMWLLLVFYLWSRTNSISCQAKLAKLKFIAPQMKFLATPLKREFWIVTCAHAHTQIAAWEVTSTVARKVDVVTAKALPHDRQSVSRWWLTGMLQQFYIFIIVYRFCGVKFTGHSGCYNSSCSPLLQTD